MHEVKMDLKDIQKTELDILLKFDEICNKHSIKYSIAYGTMLGAVRHGGFIPWDDDIDVMMSRTDYLELIRVCSKELLGTKYEVASMHLDDDYFAPLAKMYDTTTKVYQHYGQNEKKAIGVYIDIFIVDGLPPKMEDVSSFYKKAERLRRKWSLSVRKLFSNERNPSIKSKVFGSLISIPFKIIGYKYFRDKYDRYCASYEYSCSEYVAVVAYGEGVKKEIIKRENFENLTLIKFEKYDFSCLVDYDLYLHNMYGDYMCLPPESERVSKHKNTIVKIFKD